MREPPDWKEALGLTVEEWLALQFTESQVPGFVVCLKCAGLVADGGQARHDKSVHSFKGF